MQAVSWLLAGGEEAEEAASSDSDGEEGRAAKPNGRASRSAAPPMSAAHCTGVAKLPNVLRWLVNALGGPDDDAAAGGSQGGGSQGERTAATDSGSDARAPALGAEDAGPKFIVFAHHRTVSARPPTHASMKCRMSFSFTY